MSEAETGGYIILYGSAAIVILALRGFDNWMESRKQKRREHEYSDPHKCRERWRKISSGEIPVPIHTSRNGTQSIDNMDLMHSPQFRAQLKQMKASRRRALNGAERT